MAEKVKEQIKEINQHVKAGIEQLANVCLTADADEWSSLLSYDKDDMMNVILLFSHVCSNIGIKAGIIRENEAVAFGGRIRQLAIEMTGIDPHHAFDEVKQEAQ